MTAKKRWTKWLYLPDPHGHHVCRKSWAVARAFYADYQPDRVIYGGDVFDLSPIRKGASKEEQAQSMQPDFDEGMQLFRDIPPTDFIQGNHDYRAWQESKNGTGAVADFCRHLTGRIEAWAKAEGVTIYPYRANVFCPLGSRLKAMHGNVCNMHAAKSLAESYGCIVAGHTHRIDYHKAKSIDQREAWTVGCLSEIWQTYNETRAGTLQHRHGFAFGEYAGDLFDVQVAKEGVDGLWRIPTSIKVYGKAHK